MDGLSLTLFCVCSWGTARSEVGKVALKIQEMVIQRPKNSETSEEPCPRTSQKTCASRLAVTPLNEFTSMCLCPSKSNGLATPVVQYRIKSSELMAGSLCTSAEYSYQGAFRNFECNVNWSNCLSIRFGNSMFTWKWKNGILVIVFSWRNKGNRAITFCNVFSNGSLSQKCK